MAIESDNSTDREDTTSAGDISLKDLVYLFKEKWILGLSIAFSISVILVFFLIKQDKIYQSEASLLFETQSDNVLDMEKVVEEGFDDGRNAEFGIRNHLKQMKSHTFLLEVFRLLPLEVKDRIYELSESKKPKNRAILEAIKEAINIYSERGTLVITTSVKHRDPKISCILANTIVDGYVNFMLRNSDVSNNAALQFLQKQSEMMLTKVKVAEQAVQNYRQQKNLVAIEENETSVNKKIASLNDKINSISLQIIDLSVQINDTKSANGNWEMLIQIPYYASYGEIPQRLVQLNNLVSERKRLEETFLERYPLMVENAAQIEAITHLIEERLKIAIADLNKRYQSLIDNQVALKAELTKAENVALALSRAITNANSLQRDLDRVEKSYDQILKRFQEARITSQLDNSTLQIIDRAVVSDREDYVWPDIKIILFLAFCTFFSLFICIPFVFGLLDTRIKRVEDITNMLHIECLATIPKAKNEESKERFTNTQVVLNETDEVVVESFRGLYGVLQLSAIAQGIRSFLVTSTIPTEGKSFVVANLAAVYAKHGFKTLVIDCDLRRPVQHQILSKNKENKQGILSLLDGNHHNSASTLLDSEFEKKIHIEVCDHENLFLLPSGGTSKRPSEIFSDSRFTELWKYLQKEYDIIIIDTPPVGLFPDALFLAKFAQNAIFTCKRNTTNRYKARAEIKKLTKTGTNVLGSVLNHSDSSRQQEYYAGYYNR